MKIFYTFVLILTILIFLPISVYAVSSHEECPLSAGFWYEEGTDTFFRQTYNTNFKEWAEKQIDAWDQILSQSGATDCFKVGKVVRVADGSLPLAGGLPTNNPDYRDRSVDVVWGFPAAGTKDRAFWDRVMIADKGVDWGLIHELSHARYLVDSYCLDTYDGEIQVLNPKTGQRIAGSSDTPFPDLGIGMVYKNKSRDLMGGGGVFYAPHSAGAFNRIAGQHTASLYGNWNAPENVGAFVEDLPARNILEIRDKNDKPLPGAQINIFRSIFKPSSGYCGKEFDNIPDISDITGINGRVLVGSNPFGDVWPGRKILPNMQNGLFVLEVFYGDQLDYKMIEVSDFNLAYWKGATEEATYVIKTNIDGSKSNSNSALPVRALPQFSNLAATLTQDKAIFNFSYSGTVPLYYVQISTQQSMASAVYPNFAVGSNSPLVNNDPSKAGLNKWYKCGQIIYWRVSNSNYMSNDRIFSDIQQSVVDCSGATPAPTPQEKYQKLTFEVETRCGIEDKPFSADVNIFKGEDTSVPPWGGLKTDESGKGFQVHPLYEYIPNQEYTLRGIPITSKGGRTGPPDQKVTLPEGQPSSEITVQQLIRYPECPEDEKMSLSVPGALSPLSQITRIIISNYEDFRDSNLPYDDGDTSLNIDNPRQKQTVNWVLRADIPQKKLYIREFTSDGEYSDSEVEVTKSGEAIKYKNLTIIPKIIKKVTKIIINGRQEFTPSSSGDNIKIELTEEQKQLTSLDIPIKISYSDGSTGFVTWHINLKGKDVAPIPSPSSDQPAPPSDSSNTCPYAELPQPEECPYGGVRKCTGTLQGGVCKYDPAVNPDCKQECNPAPESGCGKKPGSEGSECDWDKKQVYEYYFDTCTNDYVRTKYEYVSGECGYVASQPDPNCKDDDFPYYWDQPDSDNSPCIYKHKEWKDNKCQVSFEEVDISKCGG